jgi:hypothetical protein
MFLASVAVLTLAFGIGAAPKSDSPVAVAFAKYCQIDRDGSKDSPQPYCTDPVPENVEWLVLYSICAAPRHDGKYESICTSFSKDVVTPDAKIQRQFLTYNPRVDRWDGIMFTAKKGTDGNCEKGRLDAPRWYCRATDSSFVDIDETGMATVTRAQSNDIPVVIVGTNPLLYQTTPETVTSESIASLAQLQELALGLGSALQAAVGIYSKSKTDPLRAQGLMQRHLLMELPPADKVEPPALIDVVVLYDETVERMANASTNLGQQAGAAGIARAQTIVVIQDAEQQLARAGDSLTVQIGKADSGTAAYSDLEAAYTELDAAFSAVRDFGGRCRPLLNDFLYIMQHADASESLVRARIDGYLRYHQTYAECAGEFGKLAEQIDKNAHALKAVGAGQPFTDLFAKTSANYNASLTIILNLPAKPDGADPKGPTPLEAALDLLTTKRNEGLSAYNSLVTAWIRRQDYAFADTTMMTWLYVQPKTDQLPWSRLQTHAFSIKPNAPLAASVTASHPDENALKYKLQSSKGTGLGVGLGIIYTKLSQPTFGAVTDPNDKDKMVVSQTDTSTLGGQVALFADWRLLSLFHNQAEQWLVRPSLQIGTNTSTTPGAFVGFSFDLFKYFRFGIGETWQQSKKLTGGQVADHTNVSSKDDIKTADFFAHRMYISFSFALDSLPVFKKSDPGGSSPKDKANASGASTSADTSAPKATDKKGG